MSFDFVLVAEGSTSVLIHLAPILKQCKYFFELEPVFGTRHANVRLASARGLPALTEEISIFGGDSLAIEPEGVK